MEHVSELLCYYVALIRSAYLVHQNHHWLVSGKNFYGNHLLFERIYKSAADDADLAAEKFIGLFGSETIDLHMQSQMIGKLLEEFSSGDPVQTSINIEKKFLTCSTKVYNILKQDGRLSLGLDDMIMSIAGNREAALYLLKQANENGEDMNSKMAARLNILKNIKTAQQLSPEQMQVALVNWLRSAVPSMVNGRYRNDGFTVSVDLQNKKIMGHVMLPVWISPEVQEKIENMFMAQANQMLPKGADGKVAVRPMIMLGFSMPKK